MKEWENARGEKGNERKNDKSFLPITVKLSDNNTSYQHGADLTKFVKDMHTTSNKVVQLPHWLSYKVVLWS